MLHITIRTSDRCACLRPRRQAFTLLEVMIVVAVTAVLAAVLLSTIRIVRARARQTACLANLRSIAVGWQGYLIDSKGFFLKSLRGQDNVEVNFGGKQGGTSTFRVPKPLNRYLGLPMTTTRADALCCPGDIGFEWMKSIAYDYYGTSYRMNHMLVGQPTLFFNKNDVCALVLSGVSARITDLRDSQTDTPGRLLLVGDYAWYPTWSSAYTAKQHADWHARKMHHNAAFMDGHADFIRFRKGMHTTSQYTVIPFRDQQLAAVACQQEVECE